MSVPAAPSPGPEAARLAALRRYEILDTPAEEAFERVVDLAAELFGTPIALVSLLDENRQWFKARLGLDLPETPRAWSFCDHALKAPRGDVMVVPDASRDPRFATNPLVLGAPEIRFYAGAPIRTPDGYSLGTVCVISPDPRPAGLAQVLRRRLCALADMAATELELRAQQRLTQRAMEAEGRLRRAQDSAGALAFEVASAGELLASAERLTSALGAPALPMHRATIPAALEPADPSALDAELRRVAFEGGRFAVEFRLRRPAAEPGRRWVQVRGTVAQDEQAPRITGVALDVTARREAEEALRASEARLRLAQAAGGVGVWEWDPETGATVLTEALRAMLGLPSGPEGAAPTLDSFLARVHPEDRERVRTAVGAAASTEEEFAEEFRILRPRDGVAGEAGWEVRPELRWVLARGRRFPASPGQERGPLRGVLVDVTERREAEDLRTLLAREVDHRSKNALAVVLATLRLTRADTVEAYRRLVEGRVAALARAQTELAGRRWAGADLRAIIAGELDPFLARGGAAAARAKLEGPAVLIAPHAAQPLAMAFHELATNALKHGALSAPGGSVLVRWEADAAAGELRLDWQETGGPALPGKPARTGFGTRVLAGTIHDQLGGRIASDWPEAGLRCRITLPLARILPGAADPRAASDGTETLGH